MTSQLPIYAFVFARGGSKGVVRKNLREIDGVSLVERAIRTARGIDLVSSVFVSTDDQEIASVSEVVGATVIRRPDDLSTDDSAEWSAWRHAVNWVRDRVGDFSVFLSVPPTAPLRSAGDLQVCIAALDSRTDVVVTMTPAVRNPWFNMVLQDEEGYVHRVIASQPPIVRRQDAPDVFDLSTVAFVTRPDFIMSHDSIWDGKIRGIQVAVERAIDIDSELDLRMAQFLSSELTSSDDDR